MCVVGAFFGVFDSVVADSSTVLRIVAPLSLLISWLVNSELRKRFGVWMWRTRSSMLHSLGMTRRTSVGQYTKPLCSFPQVVLQCLLNQVVVCQCPSS